MRCDKRNCFVRGDGVCGREEKDVLIYQCAAADRQHGHSANPFGKAEGKNVAIYLYVGNHLLLL